MQNPVILIKSLQECLKVQELEQNLAQVFSFVLIKCKHDKGRLFHFSFRCVRILLADRFWPKSLMVFSSLLGGAI